MNESDNVLELIFSIQMNSDIMLEMASVQEYGQKMLRTHVNGGESKNKLQSFVNEYKGQIIMGVTIQSVYWYKNNKDKIGTEEMIKLYKRTLEKLK